MQKFIYAIFTAPTAPNAAPSFVPSRMPTLLGLGQCDNMVAKITKYGQTGPVSGCVFTAHFEN